MSKQFAAAAVIAAIVLSTGGLSSLGGGSFTNISGGSQDATPAALSSAKAAPIPNAEPGADPLAPRKIKKNVIAFHTADQKMNAAKAKARQTLPRFAKMWEDGVSGTYTVKFPLTQNGETEHIWLQVDGFDGDKINGRLANEPVNGTDYKIGQRMAVARSDVEDWMVNQGDAIYGGYSARVAMAELPEEERARYAKLFRD